MLNDYYQNVGIKGFFKRYGVVNALRRGSFMANRLHLVQDYEMRKVLWQRAASKKAQEFLKFKNENPEGLVFTDAEVTDPVWLYWDQGLVQAPDLVKKCYAAARKFHGDNVILLTAENLGQYLHMPRYLIDKVENGEIPLAIYTDLMRIALLEHYGGTWMDATVYLTDQIPQTIHDSDFFVFHNSLGLLQNPALYPVWFIHAKKHNTLIRQIRNVAFAYWKREKHLREYLFSNLIFTAVIHDNPNEEAKIPYMGSDYSEYLVRKLGDDYNPKEFEWIKKLTGIHKLTYKLDDSINREGSIYHHIMTG